MDPYGNPFSVTAPARSVRAVTPSDSIALDSVSNVLPKALYVGTGGDIKILAVDDTLPVTFKNVPSGSYLDVMPTKVYATGTTATDILALAG